MNFIISNWFLLNIICAISNSFYLENNKELDKYLDFKKMVEVQIGEMPLMIGQFTTLAMTTIKKKGIAGDGFQDRALNVLNRFANLTEKEVDKAFKKSIKEKKPVLLGVSGHDWRNLITEVDHIYNLIIKSSKKFNNAKFEFCTTSDGFRKTIWPNKKKFEKFNLKIKINKKPKNDYPNILIENNSSQIFGPQPFFAIKTKSRNFLF